MSGRSDPAPRSDPGHSLGEIIASLAADIQDLVRGEIRLARAEFDHKLSQVTTAAASVIGGALFAFAGLVILLEGVGASLALVLPGWAAFLVVGAVVVIGGALAARAGLARLSANSLVPERMTASLQQDARVVKETL